jgi:2-amino-4-hydroxy-6-hydroxymethyldihydropteridine diphosphokinase
MPFVPVAIALGSNLGDRRAHLEWAIDALRNSVRNIKVSSIIETAPFDVPDEQPFYLNAVLVGETDLSAAEVLTELARLETDRGRTRPSFRASRTLDLDLILHGDTIASTDTLNVPHPRFREREFVLAPLAEIAPGLLDPVTGLTVGELCEKFKVRGAKFNRE